MIKAGSLTYAIFLAVITAIICFMMILLAFNQRSYFIKMDVHEILKDNAHSGIALGMTRMADEDLEKWIDLYENGTDSVYLKKRRWGAYQVISSVAVKGDENYKKSAIIGTATGLFETTALWLTDLNSPLHLAGNALLKGNAYLPRKGLDRAYIEGVNYERDQLIYGPTKKSTGTIPSPEKKLKDYWRAYFGKTYPNGDSIIGFEDLPLQITHPFHRRTLLAYSPAPVSLSGFTLAGNIILISNEKITVSVSANLRNVVLIAPSVVIEPGAEILCQVIASDTVIIGRNAVIRYPGSIIMAAPPRSEPYLKMEKGAKLVGSVLSFKENVQRSNNLAVEIAEEAELKGLLYSQGNLELNGSVKGTVVCNKFLLVTASGIYENHLLNGKIDRTALPKEFAGPGFSNLQDYSVIVSWPSY